MAEKEIRQFDAEVGKVLHLMIHSLYTNKEIFLRELISNASDACDKLRYLSVTQADLRDNEDEELAITITLNEKLRTLTIHDNGLGMSHDELIENLGTVARSGTQRFLEQMAENPSNDTQLIGQFGVGFYSSYIVADSVSVISRKAGEETTWKWESDGQGEFSIEQIEGKGDRGTTITLQLKEGEESYCEKFRVRHIIKTYSDHVAFPIQLIEEGADDSDAPKADEEATDVTAPEIVNSASALWTRSKSDISEEQYQEFYKSVAHSPDTPWATLHNKNEGVIEYTNLLFIPSRQPFDLFHPDRRCRVKLYVKRVYITDENVNLIPGYLRFLQGVIDSEDLPLNISRETLQDNHIIEKIRKSVTKRVLSELKKKSEKEPEEYETFWENFGAALKEGLCEGIDTDRERLLEVCRFKHLNDDKTISLDQYIEAMHEKQQDIYYITGSDTETIKNSPQLEGFIKRGIDVLVFTDMVDDFWVNVVPDYKEKGLKSVTRADIELGDIPLLEGEEEDAKAEEKKEALTDEDSSSLIEHIKTVLDGKVHDVRISKKLTDSPVCLVVAEGAMDIRMERYLIEQRQLAARSTKILEINDKHPIIQQLSSTISAGNGAQTDDMIRLLFDQACIIEGEPITDVGSFSRRLNQFLEKAIAA